MTKAETIITNAIATRLSEILTDLANFDRVLDKLGRKGSQADLNLRTAALALNAVAATL